MSCLLCGRPRSNRDREIAEKEEIQEAVTCIIESEFVQNTTCHGMAFWYSSRYTVQRVFWILLVVGMTSAMCQQVATRVIAYYEYKASTDISSEFVNRLPFPAVTICNFNRYFFPESPEEEATMRALNRVASPKYVQFASRFGISLGLDDLEFFDNLNINVSDYMDQKGYPFRDRAQIRECMFAGERCTQDDFTPVLTTSGKCYTFNSNLAEERYQWVSGLGSGLTLTIDALHWNYTEEPNSGNQEAGIRFEVHSKDVPPNVDKKGIGVPVGTKAYALLSRKDTEVMYKPWGMCDPENEKTLQYFANYSLQACMQECYTHEVVHECGCRTFDQHWVTDTVECTPMQMANCTSPLVAQLEQTLTPEECLCTVPCRSKTFSARTSYARLPNINMASYFATTFRDTSTYLEGNLLAVDISFEQMAFTKEIQSKLIDESSLLSDLGGQLGLWVGMSLITIFEFIQYIVMRLSACVVLSGKRIKMRRKKASTNGHINDAFER